MRPFEDRKLTILASLFSPGSVRLEPESMQSDLVENISIVHSVVYISVLS